MQALIPCDLVLVTVSSMKCIRFDVCKADTIYEDVDELVSSMKCIRFDVCKNRKRKKRGFDNIPQ